MAKYGTFKYGQEMYGTGESEPEPDNLPRGRVVLTLSARIGAVTVSASSGATSVELR